MPNKTNRISISCRNILQFHSLSIALSCSPVSCCLFTQLTTTTLIPNQTKQKQIGSVRWNRMSKTFCTISRYLYAFDAICHTLMTHEIWPAVYVCRAHTTKQIRVRHTHIIHTLKGCIFIDIMSRCICNYQQMKLSFPCRQIRYEMTSNLIN